MNRERKNSRLPKHVRELFWEYGGKKITWESNSDMVIRKALESGHWDSIVWLLRTAGHDPVRQWLTLHNGGGLDVKKLRFWQVILDIPERRVDTWVERVMSNPWGRRLQH